MNETTRLTEKKTVNISVNIPITLAEKLDKVRRYEERAKSFYVRKALEKYLEEKLEDIEDYIDAKQAHEELIASGEKTTPWEEIKRKSKLLDAQGK